MPWIARAARAAREQRGRSRSHIAVERGVVESTVTRFEGGHMQEIDVDAMIGAYARDLEMTPYELWQLALEMWGRALETPTNARVA
jgi:hypothetical protein